MRLKLRRGVFEGGKESSCVFPRADYAKIRGVNFPLTPSVWQIQFDFVTSVSQRREIPPYSRPAGVKANCSLEEKRVFMSKTAFRRIPQAQSSLLLFI